ncbi:MAG: hypothetical protein HY719_07585 [Planctomycetes bacterium]|nr:hypothetical protein [Planctomycetota bacterium]
MSPDEAIGRFASTAALLTLAVTGMGYIVFRNSGDPALRAMCVASVVCLAAFSASLVPLRRVVNTKPLDAPPLVLVGTVLRLGLTFVFGWVASLFFQPDWRTLLIWAIVVYLVLLAAETAFAMRLVRLAGEWNAAPADLGPRGSGGGGGVLDPARAKGV